MLEIGSYLARHCQGVSRRAFLKAGFSVPLAMGLAGAKSVAPATSPRAKSVLLVWLGGGPSHLDLFDPKPKAPADIRGPVRDDRRALPGVRLHRMLPKLAARSDQYSLVRTNINFNGGHRPAGSIGLTGALATDGGEDRAGTVASYPPNFGAILAKHRGAGALPGFISLARGPVGDGVGPILGYGGGKWGKSHDPFMLDCSEAGAVSIPELKLLDGLTPARLENRRNVLRGLDRTRRRMESAGFEKWDSNYERPTRSQFPSTNSVFDLSRESEATRAAYGRTSFGQSCLLGRGSSRPAFPTCRSTGANSPKSFTVLRLRLGHARRQLRAAGRLARAAAGSGVSRRCSTTCATAVCSRRRWWSAWASSAARRASMRSPREITGPIATFRFGRAAG